MEKEWLPKTYILSQKSNRLSWRTQSSADALMNWTALSQRKQTSLQSYGCFVSLLFSTTPWPFSPSNCLNTTFVYRELETQFQMIVGYGFFLLCFLSSQTDKTGDGCKQATMKNMVSIWCLLTTTITNNTNQWCEYHIPAHRQMAHVPLQTLLPSFESQKNVLLTSIKRQLEGKTAISCFWVECQSVFMWL